MTRLGQKDATGFAIGASRSLVPVEGLAFHDVSPAAATLSGVPGLQPEEKRHGPERLARLLAFWLRAEAALATTAVQRREPRRQKV